MSGLLLAGWILLDLAWRLAHGRLDLLDMAALAVVLLALPAAAHSDRWRVRS